MQRDSDRTVIQDEQYYASSARMDNGQRNPIKNYLDFLLRRKTILIFFLILGFAGGLAQYLRMPKIYQSTALLKYQRQSVNPSAMSPDDARTRPEDVVDTVTQQILSRSSLESIIKEQNLYPEMRKNIPMETIVGNMRKFHIQTVTLEDGDVFQVSFRGRNQEKVMKTANALAAKFIEENLRFRQDRATQTSGYIRDELSMAKKGLDEKEVIMRDYKLQYYNEMPERLVNNTNRLNALQEQYQNNQSSMLEMERTKLMVQEQISQRQEIMRLLEAGSNVERNTPAEQNELLTPQQIRMKIKQLSTRYTDKHPEIRRLKKQLKDLESQFSENDFTESDADRQPEPVTIDPQLQELHQQLTSIQFNLKRLEKERLSLEQQIRKYENWINVTPVREAEWSKLTRDYQQLNEHYQELVRQNLQAESTLSLEQRMKGSQFNIVDQAHFPEKPIEPKFKKVMLMAIIMALALGGSLAIGLELISPSYRDPVKLETNLGLPIICSIPVVHSRKELSRMRIKGFAVNFSLFLAGTAAVAAAAYFYMQGLIVI